MFPVSQWNVSLVAQSDRVGGMCLGEPIDPTSSIAFPLFAHDKLREIFERFFRTKEHYIGIELSVAGTIVRAHNGPIRAERGFGC